MDRKLGKITTIDELKKLAAGPDGLDCAIALQGGLKSSKHIAYKSPMFYIWNLMDDTTDILTEEQLFDRSFSNVGYALSQGMLFAE